MNQRIADEILWRYVDVLHSGSENIERCLSLFPRHRGQLEPLLSLARRLSPALTPVQPSPAFARHLKQELLVAAAARSLATSQPASHQDLWWRAAALGSAVSVVAAVAVMWHSHARTGERDVGGQPVAAGDGHRQHLA